ncbi:MAG: MBL fold metallo-hydrolase [Nitrospinae bacterium]|nr:MBL fold metallo-hydrolase [Nitrospinota bacterium]
MMKTTLIGHACLLIQSKNCVLLTDPVFFDPHWEEINVLCPAVDLELDKVPEFDVLYLSHRHQDHFDVRTLAYLPKDRMVIAPGDKVLLDVLKELGYRNVRVSEDFEPIKIKDLTLTPTPSITQDPYPEHGLLIHDGEVAVWNQVDTIVTPKIVQYIQELYGRLDFAHVRFQPLIEGNFTFHKALELPFQEYASFLKVVKALGPRFAVPGAAGFRYVDEFGFLNRYSFPTAPTQFIMDLAEFCPAVKTSLFNPGDVAEISREGVKILPQNSDFVRVREDNGHLAEFKPVSEVYPIRTRTVERNRQEEERTAVTRFIEEELLPRLKRTKMFEVWTHWRVVYQLEVFGQDGSDIWSVDFGNEARLEKGRIGKINLYEGIACSELYRLIKNETNWDFVGASAQYRTFHNVYRVADGDIEFYPQANKFPQPLMETFPQDDAMDREKYLKDVRRWKK